VGRYVQELTAALLAIDHDSTYSIFYNQASTAQMTPPLDRLACVATSRSNKLWRMGVVAAYLARRSQDSLFPGVDLFHATDHLLPRLSRICSVLTVHDVTPRLFPATHSRWNRWFFDLMMPRFLKATSAIIADSESTRRDVERLYNVSRDKSQVIYPGVHERFQPASSPSIAAVRGKYCLPERFILYVGTLEPRKNLSSLLDAFAMLQKRQSARRVKLVLAGKKGWLYASLFQRLQTLGLADDVLFTGFVDDDDIPGLYSAADLFVYPSLYEGFGLPVLEAMACGTAVVCSNTSSLPEVAGDAAVLVSPQDTTALAREMDNLLEDRKIRLDLIDKGFRQAQRFTWHETARQTLAVYRRVHNG
jgi:glycosyltransferase involved in cell wall biosynthesis